MTNYRLALSDAQTVSLIGLMLDAPLMAVLRRWPRLIHAVTMEGVLDGWAKGGRTYETACGVTRARLYGGIHDDRPVAYLFPPRLKGMPDDHERCQPCWEATGRKRPRSTSRATA